MLTVSHVEANSAINIKPGMWHLLSDGVNSYGFNYLCRFGINVSLRELRSTGRLMHQSTDLSENMIIVSRVWFSVSLGTVFDYRKYLNSLKQLYLEIVKLSGKWSCKQSCLNACQNQKYVIASLDTQKTGRMLPSNFYCVWPTTGICFAD